MSETFYAALPIHACSLSQLLADERHFTTVPADWHVVVTDIKNSTGAFKAGRSEEINLIATGCIIAVLNLAHRAGVQVPFFFGGDGAMLLVPATLLEAVLGALYAHRDNTQLLFGLELRVGAVPVSDLAAEGLKISRVQLSPAFSIPIVLGHGLAEAEHRVKANDPSPPAFVGALNLDGMECRWDKIRPPEASEEVVCLLVSAGPGRPQADTFKHVIDVIDAVYGPYLLRNPVTRSRLRLKGSLGKIALEMNVRLGKRDWGYLFKNWLITLFGKLWYIRRGEGAAYADRLVELTDTLVIDGRINTVIAGTAAQRMQLTSALDRMEGEGRITYGLFVSRESVMSCYVRDRQDQHIHFVDGSDGGYTMASTVLKRKLSNAGGAV